MAANINDKFTKSGSPETLTDLQAPGKALAATSINIGSATGWPTDTAVYFAIRQVDSSGALVAGTYTEFKGIVSGTTIGSLQLVHGTDQVYPAGSTTQVYIPVISARFDAMVEGLEVSMNKATGALKDGAVGTSSIDDASVTPAKWTNPYCFSAAKDAAQSLPIATLTKVEMDEIEYDINGDFDIATYAYTAPVDGIYHFSANVALAGGTQAVSNGIVGYSALAVNDTAVKRGVVNVMPNFVHMPVSADIELEAGDEVTVYCSLGAVSQAEDVSRSPLTTYFGGHLVHQI